MSNLDFMADEGQFVEEEPNFPTVFGVQITPTVAGVLLALVGVGAAVFTFINLLQPTMEQNTFLKSEVAELEGQIQDPVEAQRLIDEAEERVQVAEQLQADVLALFADEASLETLLLDINERVRSANAGVTDESRQAILSRFEVNEDASGVITDGSLGEAVNGRLSRLVYNLEMEGSYAQTQSILRSIERLQPLLVVQGFRTELQPIERVLDLDTQGNVVQVESSQPRLTTSFRLDALSPSEQLPPAEATGAEGEAVPEGEGT